MCTDASDVGLEGKLMQERNGNAYPNEYASRLCTAAEKKYIITERETLAVIYCLEHFRDIILGYKIRLDKCGQIIRQFRICLNIRTYEVV